MAKQKEILLKRKGLKDSFRKLNAQKVITFVIIIICIVSDFITIYSFTMNVIANEYQYISVLCSGTAAIGLDASLAYAAILLNRSGISSDPKVQRQSKIVAAVMFGAFLLSYVAVLSLAIADSHATGKTNLVDSGAFMRLLLPGITSIISFALSKNIDPAKDRIAEIDALTTELRLQMDQEEATAERLRTVFKLYDPAKFDLMLYHIAVQRLKAQSACAQHRQKLLLAEELGVSDATNQLLLNTDFQELLDEMESLGQNLNLRPDSACHSGSTPEFNTELSISDPKKVDDESNAA